MKVLPQTVCSEDGGIPLPAHKIAGVRETIEADARLLYLPPHSADLNPIEMAYAQLKALLPKAVTRAIPLRGDNIGELLSASPKKTIGDRTPKRTVTHHEALFASGDGAALSTFH